MLHDLELDYGKNFPYDNFGTIFKRFVPFLKIYTNFISNYDNASKLVNELQEKSPKFTDFCDKVFDETSHTLASLLVTPIQRIPIIQTILYINTLIVIKPAIQKVITLNLLDIQISETQYGIGIPGVCLLQPLLKQRRSMPFLCHEHW